MARRGTQDADVNGLAWGLQRGRARVPYMGVGWWDGGGVL